jgi:hypothetical protein
VSARDFSRNAQAQARAFSRGAARLRGAKEGLEDPRLVFRRNTWTLVTNGDAHDTLA